jgi:hypothetical protein
MPIEKIWDLLGHKSSQLFGRECASATIWMLVSLAIRCIFVISLTEKYIPYGIFFSIHFLIQMLSANFPFMNDSCPILAVRIAESVLGNINVLVNLKQIFDCRTLIFAFCRF